MGRKDGCKGRLEAAELYMYLTFCIYLVRETTLYIFIKEKSGNFEKVMFVATIL